ncbi:MAG: type II secretion system F family protein [Actinomycetota bacterium]
MPTYRYTAVDPSGARLTGRIEGTSASAARNLLISQQLDVRRLAEHKPWTQIEITREKIKPADVMNFSRQLGAFLRAGIPILDALNTLEEGAENKVLRRTLAQMQDSLRAGSSFSDAVAEHEDIFPTYYVGILRSAELTGSLDVVLDQLARYIERDLETRRSIRSALTYPIVIVGMATVTVTVLVAYVLPKFEDFFASFDARLPLPTRLLLGFGRFVSNDWWAILAAIFLLLLLGFLAFRGEGGKGRRDALMLRTPVIGDVVRYGVVERFCRILGAMMRAGVPVPDAIDAAAEATNNRVYQRALAGAKTEMLRGEGLARPIGATALFPGAAAQMIQVGESSGTLDEQLDITADFYETELRYKVKRLTTLFEPAIILFMGLIVGFVAIALVSAMYGIFNQVDVR